MSLVNDMLRDLEARRAAPDERLRLGNMHAVDEAGAARRARSQQLRKRLLVALVVGLLAVALFALGIELRPAAEPARVPSAAVEPVEPTATVADREVTTRLLDVLPQNDGQHFVLQLLLDRPVSYQRTDATGSVSFALKDVRFAGEALSGRIERNGQTLSWRVEGVGEDVHVLLIGFGEQLTVADRLELAGDRSQLWLEVTRSDADEEESTAALPVAEQAERDQSQWPDWVTRDAPAAEPFRTPMPAEPAPAQLNRQKAAPVAEPVAAAGPKALSIGAHQPDALASARQALARGDHLSAIQQLQALHQAQPDNPDISRWLARAYLAAGDTVALLGWLPSQLQAHPFDAQMRELLARGQLQAGDQHAAIATLQQHVPELRSNTAYHALLAALHQQVGDWAASATRYRQLVAFQPGQGAWQLGLAIALEQLDQPAQAGRHYLLALQGQGLDQSARQFASERAGSLGGTR